MEKLRTVRGVHDLLPQELYKHNKVIDTALVTSDDFNLGANFIASAKACEGSSEGEIFSSFETS